MVYDFGISIDFSLFYDTIIIRRRDMFKLFDKFKIGEYGYFVKNEEARPKVYTGVYNNKKNKVYLFSEDKIYKNEYLTDIIKVKNGDVKGLSYRKNSYYQTIRYKNEPICNMCYCYSDDIKCICTKFKLLKYEAKINRELSKIFEREDSMEF